MERLGASQSLEDLSVDDIFDSLVDYQAEAPELSTIEREAQFTRASQEAEEAAIAINDLGNALVLEVEAFLQSDAAEELTTLQNDIQGRIASGDLCCGSEGPEPPKQIQTANVTSVTSNAPGSVVGGGGASHDSLLRRSQNKQKTKKKPGGWCAGLIALLCFIDLS